METIERTDKVLTGAEEVSTAADVVLALAQGTLKLGSLLPGAGGACRVALEILNDVERLKDKADDVLAAGRRVEDVLKMLVKFEENAKTLGEEARNEINERIEKLRDLLEAVKDAVLAFGKKGFFTKLFRVSKKAKTLSKLDKEIRDAVEYIQVTYKLAQDMKLMEVTYRLEAAMQRLVHHQSEAGETDEQVSVDVEIDAETMITIAGEGGISNEVLFSELIEFTKDIQHRLSKLTQVSEDIRHGVHKLLTARQETALLSDTSSSTSEEAATDSGEQDALLLRVFEIVMRRCEDEASETAAKEELEELFIDHDTSIDRKKLIRVRAAGLETKKRCTPMHVACALGKTRLATCLYVEGFDLNAKDQAKRLPFHYAARHGHTDLVEWIIQLHKHPERLIEGSTRMSQEMLLKAIGTDGLDAFDLAVLAGEDAVVKVMKRYLDENGLSEDVNFKEGHKLSSALMKVTTAGDNADSDCEMSRIDAV